MKKFGIFAAALFAAVAFTSCEPKPGPTPDIDNLVEDGFYAVGEACPVKTVNDANAVLAQLVLIHQHFVDTLRVVKISNLS